MTADLTRSRKILVVDDDKAQCQLIVEALREAGYEASPVFNGPEGLARFKAEQPDMVIIDFAMPGMNGFEVVQEMRRHEIIEGNSRALITMISAYSQTFLVASDFQVGIDSYLTKPLLPTELISRVDDLFAGREAPAI